MERQALRDLLIDALRPDTIRWDSRLTGIEPGAVAQGGHLLRFADGTAFAAEVVVGADGANSGVRPLLTDAQPAYAGVSFVEIGIADAARRHPACAALAGSGSLFALDDDMGILAKHGGDGCIRIYAAFRVPPFAGAGANMVMQDGAELALALVRASDANAAIAGYERAMFIRAEQAARQSARGLDICIAEDGAERTARMLRGVPQAA